MEDAKLLVELLVFAAGLAGTWAVLRLKSKEHDTRIAEAEKKVTELDKAVAVLASRQDDHGNRIEAFTTAIEQMEQRIVAQVKQLFEAFSRGQK